MVLRYPTQQRRRVHPLCRTSHRAVFTMASLDDGASKSYMTQAQIKQLTSSIARCTDLDQLDQLVRQHWAVLDHIHIPAAMVKAAKLRAIGYQQQRQGQALMNDLVQLLMLGKAPLLSRFTEQGLSNAVWALAKMNMCQQHAAFFEKVSDLMQEQCNIQSTRAQGVATAAWAYAQLARQSAAAGEKPPPYIEQLLQTLTESAWKHLPEFNAQDVSNMLWALASAGIYDKGLIKSLAQHFCHIMKSSSDQNLSMVAWALSDLRHRDEQIMAQLVDEALTRPMFGSTAAQHVCNLVFACANLDCCQHLPQLQDLGAKLQPGRTNYQVACNLAWAHAVMGVYRPWLLDLIGQVVHPSSRESLAPAGLGQLALYFILLQDKYPQQLAAAVARMPWLAEPRSAALDCHLGRNKMYADRTRAMPHQRQLLAACQAAWPSPDCSVNPTFSTPDGHFHCHVMVMLASGVKIAINLHSKPAYTRTEPHTLLGGTQLAGRFMQCPGWRVVHVLEHEWQALASEEARQNYLKRVVQEQQGQ